jgi:hypothetical protein
MDVEQEEVQGWESLQRLLLYVDPEEQGNNYLFRYEDENIEEIDVEQMSQ